MYKRNENMQGIRALQYKCTNSKSFATVSHRGSTPTFRQIWEAEKVPNGWREGILIKIHKER
jgi:hypothetical protein